MRRLVLTITMIAMCGLFAAVRGGSAPHAIKTSTETMPAVQAQDSAADTDDSQCDPATVSEDAASCMEGGWVADDCCFVSGRVQERWRLGTRSKCCGACFQ
jgi:hypothetical protein